MLYNNVYKSLSLLLCILLWYLTNTISSLYTKIILNYNNFNENNNILLFLFLSLYITFIQLMVSGLIGYFIILYYNKVNVLYIFIKEFPSIFSYFAVGSGSDSLLFTKQEYNSTVIKVGICNALGTLCTNVGYIMGSVSLVQLIKALEPVVTVIMYKYVFFMLFEYFNFYMYIWLC
jgi:hypothetical protein